MVVLEEVSEVSGDGVEGHGEDGGQNSRGLHREKVTQGSSVCE